MNEARRPGGLTALAVINFVFAGFGLLSIVGLLALLAFMNVMPTDKMDPTQKGQIEAMQEMGVAFVVLLLALHLLSATLLLLSGIGYLLQKKILGRMLGNTYAVLAVIGGLVSGLMFRTELGGGFHLGTMIGLIFPVLTLILINTTFKEDLTN
jgi:hypothetical protein